MSDAVAPVATATAPQERGWRWFAVALVLTAAVSVVQYWPPALALVGGAVRLLLPIEEFGLLVFVAIAACSVVGWWAGSRGSLILAVVWCALAAWRLWSIPLSNEGYGAFSRGWAMILGASFGLVCFATAARPFLSRAMAAVALAGAVTIIGLAGRAGGAIGPFDGASRMLGSEYSRRLGEVEEAWQRRTESPVWRAFSGSMPAAAARAERSHLLLVALAQSPSVGSGNAPGTDHGGPLLLLAPALLALESLLALALGWATYHRLTRVRIGPPLGAVRDLRFSDQWIWGLVVGCTVLLLPTLAEWRSLGMNLVCFFGTLYAFRGIGVLTWWVPDRWAWLIPVGLAVLVPLVGPISVLVTVIAGSFVLGLSDTWRDFRAAGTAGRTRSLP